jgi:hypothetical protein
MSEETASVPTWASPKVGPRHDRPSTKITNSSASRDLTSEVGFLTRALKAPTLREAAGRLAERARAEAWSHEEFLIACLQREVAAREAHGGEGRIRAAPPANPWRNSTSTKRPRDQT